MISYFARRVGLTVSTTLVFSTGVATTAVAIGTGTKSFTIGTGLAYTSLQSVILSYDGANYMIGTVTSYNSGTGALVVNVNTTVGAGTFSSWGVNLAGAAGGNGSAGTSGSSGSSGSSGANGSSGTSGSSGSSGTSGTNATRNSCILFHYNFTFGM